MDVPIPRCERTSGDSVSGVVRFAAVPGSVQPVTWDKLRLGSDLPPDTKELIDETAHSNR
jgi:hypothetical protein